MSRLATSAGDEAPSTAARSNLQLRLLTAAVGIPLLVLLAIVGGLPFALAAGVIAALAMVEFGHGFLVPSLPVYEGARHVPVAIIGAFAVVLSNDIEQAPIWAAGLGALLVAVGYVPASIIGPRRPWRVQGWAVIYVAIPLALIVLLRGLDDGRGWVFLVILATFAVDTGAYATGKTLGRHKMAPAISPGKTWEGAAGGYAFGAGAVVALVAVFDIGAPGWLVAAIAVTLPPLAMAGDLLESWLKRRMGVKDASGLLPGHGGFLDRLDSIGVVGAGVYLAARFLA